MAKEFDAGLADALRRASAVILDRRPGVWYLAFEDGLMPARARIRNGWFEVSASLPDAVLSEYDDVWALRVNAVLPARARIARPCGEAPLVKAEVFIEDNDDALNLVQATCLDLMCAVRTIADSIDEIPQVSSAPDSELSSEDVETACREAGWHLASPEGSTMCVEIPTRARVYVARLEAASSGGKRFVVEMADLSGHPAIPTRAVSALLMAVSATVQSVSGLLCHRENAELAALAAPLETPFDGSLDRALSALSVACTLAGREAAALRDPDLASQYLALRDPTRRGQLNTTQLAEVPV